MLFLPGIICILFWFKHLKTGHAIRSVAAYAREVEISIGLPENLGWESYITKHAHRHFRHWNRLYCGGSIIGNLAFGIYACSVAL